MRPLFLKKFTSMKSAAPNADLAGMSSGDGFMFLLDHARTIHRLMPHTGTFKDLGDDEEMELAEELVIPLEQMLTFTREITRTHSLSLVDSAGIGRPPVCFAHFPRTGAGVAMAEQKKSDSVWD